MDTEYLINRCEQRYNNELLSIVDEVIALGKVFVMVSGASCAGKTTTTKKLREYFALRGIHAETVSLDDFYLNHEKTPLTPEGKPDYETINSLDLDLLDTVMSELAAGKTVRVPRFDFLLKRRSDKFEEMSLDPGEVVIIEGLHAMNPLLCRHIDAGLVYRVYLFAEAEDYDAKLLRRIVRDEYYRFFGAETTLDMWDDVLRGERLYIAPYAPSADAAVNTFFEYETALLAPEGIRLLSAVRQDSPCRRRAEQLMEKIAGCGSVPYEMVPDDSLMMEFIKK